jgi:6-phosphogluconate dehydrogenase
MQIGMIGLGRMGGDMVRRLLAAGHQCLVYDQNPAAVQALAADGATGCASYQEFLDALATPRAVWLMLPAAVVDQAIEALAPGLAAGDLLVDGGNSHFVDDLRRAAQLKERGVHYLDVGTSGGVWGRERGYCLMVGGESESFERLRPALEALAPGPGTVTRSAGREGKPSDAECGFMHCGPSGAGHFVKMVHNGIEYGVMAALAEGFNILRHAKLGEAPRRPDAETAPLRQAEPYSYDFDLTQVAELWRRGSVLSSWLLDLSARALTENPSLDQFQGRVSDSGEGRWTVQVALETGVPAHVLSAALFNRFTSRGEADFADRLLSALRQQFGGHQEKTGPSGGAP